MFEKATIKEKKINEKNLCGDNNEIAYKRK